MRNWLKKVSILILVAVLFLQYDGVQCETSPTGLVGGLTSEKRADDNVKNMVYKVQDNTIQRIRASNLYNSQNIGTNLKPMFYRTQLVNGINYFVKIRAQIGGKSVYYHVRIYRDFEGKNVRLLDIQGPVRKTAEIQSF